MVSVSVGGREARLTPRGAIHNTASLVVCSDAGYAWDCQQTANQANGPDVYDGTPDGTCQTPIICTQLGRQIEWRARE